jgi:thioredoxin reductase
MSDDESAGLPLQAAKTRTTDVVIVGAGPAGLAAASVLLQDPQLHLTLVDAGVRPGGQYWRQPALDFTPFGLAGRPLRRLYHDLDVFEQLSADVGNGERSGRLELLSGCQAWTVVAEGDGYAVHLVERVRPGEERPLVRRSDRVILATGAYDRALPFGGWDLPGVMTAGGLQALLKGNDVLVGHKIAVAGTGPFLLPVAAGLADRGAHVVGVFEANSPTRWLRHAGAVAANVDKLKEGFDYGVVLARHRVPVRLRRMVTVAHGTDRVEAVTTVRLDRHGQGIPGSEERHSVDAVGVGWGFTPQLDLALTLGCELVRDPAGTAVVAVDDEQRTTRTGVYAAGEICGVGGAALAVAEGRLAAASILRRRGAHLQGTSETRARRAVARLRRFAAAMHAAYPVPDGWSAAMTADTVFCRCEEVPYAAIQATLAEHGCGSARQLKQLTRVGMGWCQGRVCGYAADLITAGVPGEPPERLVAAPISLGTLARLNEEEK